MDNENLENVNFNEIIYRNTLIVDQIVAEMDSFVYAMGILGNNDKLRIRMMDWMATLVASSKAVSRAYGKDLDKQVRQAHESSFTILKAALAGMHIGAGTDPQEDSFLKETL